MKLFLINILLAFIWVLITGIFTINNYLLGFIISYFFLWLTFRKKKKRYFTKPIKFILFISYFIKQMVKANIRVAYDVLTPSLYIHPAILSIPIRSKTDIEITILSNLISLTPGSIVMDASKQKKELYIHFMYSHHEEVLINDIKKLEDKLLDVLT